MATFFSIAATINRHVAVLFTCAILICFGYFNQFGRHKVEEQSVPLQISSEVEYRSTPYELIVLAFRSQTPPSIVRETVQTGFQRLNLEKPSIPIDVLRKRLSRTAVTGASWRAPSRQHSLAGNTDIRTVAEVVTAKKLSIPSGLDHYWLPLPQLIASSENALTARVTVNRIWQEVFERSLEKTSDDLEVVGDKLTHRELLDWLTANSSATSQLFYRHDAGLRAMPRPQFSKPPPISLTSRISPSGLVREHPRIDRFDVASNSVTSGPRFGEPDAGLRALPRSQVRKRETFAQRKGLLFLYGGPSHIDMFDPKPALHFPLRFSA